MESVPPGFRGSRTCREGVALANADILVVLAVVLALARRYIWTDRQADTDMLGPKMRESFATTNSMEKWEEEKILSIEGTYYFFLIVLSFLFFLKSTFYFPWSSRVDFISRRLQHLQTPSQHRWRGKGGRGGMI